MKSFNEWMEEKYAEAMVWRDWQTCDFLVENREMIEYGYNAALEQATNLVLNDSTLEVPVDGVKIVKGNE